MVVTAKGTFDYMVEYQGSVSLIRPTTAEAMRHLADNVQEDAQWFGGALAVEDRYVWGLAKQLESEGFRVGGDE